jgi:glycylpeptide N-tetradecanoyltransferase
VSCDLKDEKVLEEVYVLLRDHYVEDDDAKFRFDYSKALITWALLIPDYKVDWHVGVRRISDGVLMAFITGTPAHFRILKKYASYRIHPCVYVHARSRSRDAEL